MPRLSFDDALAHFTAAFLARHPRRAWPPWFEDHVTYGGQRVDGGWRLAYTASKETPLPPNRAWETTPRGGRVLVETDPKTGERSYILCGGPGENLTLFEALVAEDGAVTVLVDTPLDDVDPSGLLPIR